MSSIKRIIVIDDDPIGNIICCHTIKRYLPDMEVYSFISPEEGLKFIQSEYISSPVKTVLLLDINMPTLSGWDVLEELEYIELVKEHLLIYIFSSSISLHDKTLSRQHPLVKDFVEKPLTMQKLTHIMMQEHPLSEFSHPESRLGFQTPCYK